jgi:hypothetical protein
MENPARKNSFTRQFTAFLRDRVRKCGENAVPGSPLAVRAGEWVVPQFELFR